MSKFLAPLFASFLLLSGAVMAQTPIVMKIATVAPEKTPWDRLLREYKKNVEAKSGGRISVKVYTGGTKGDENDTVLKTRRGELQAVGASTGAIGSIVTELNVIELPYLFKSFREADAVLDNVVSSRLDPILRGYGFVLGFWSENGFRHFGTRDGFVTSPANLKGKKMRSQESKVHLETWKAFMASPTPVPTTAESCSRAGSHAWLTNHVAPARQLAWQRAHILSMFSFTIVAPAWPVSFAMLTTEA
jgi:TRAP-type C4-dicarboxylate transport system substrate-binding protein